MIIGECLVVGIASREVFELYAEPIGDENSMAKYYVANGYGIQGEVRYGTDDDAEWSRFMRYGTAVTDQLCIQNQTRAGCRFTRFA